MTSKAPLPNTLPRPDGELAQLRRIWNQPGGWRIFSAVNNTWIGLAYIATALLFLVLAGGAAAAAHHEALVLGFEGAILRILSACWVVGLLGSNAALTAINYIHHRNRI